MSEEQQFGKDQATGEYLMPKSMGFDPETGTYRIDDETILALVESLKWARGNLTLENISVGAVQNLLDALQGTTVAAQQFLEVMHTYEANAGYRGKQPPVMRNPDYVPPEPPPPEEEPIDQPPADEPPPSTAEITGEEEGG